MLQLEEAFLAVGIHVVADGRAAQRDGFVQNFLQRSVQLAQLLAGERRRTAPRADAGAKQRLVGVDVADAAQQLLIEQRALDRRLALAKELDKAIGLRLQWLVAGSSETADGFLVEPHHRQPAEAPRIDEAQLAPGLQLEHGVGVLQQLIIGLRHLHASGHAEVHDPLSVWLRLGLCRCADARSRSNTMCLPTRRTSSDARALQNGGDFFAQATSAARAFRPARRTRSVSPETRLSSPRATVSTSGSSGIGRRAKIG